MASPFDVFRKNPKAWLAVVGIMAMIAFVVGSAGLQLIGSNTGGRQNNPVVMSWQFGEMREADVEHRLQMRRVLNSFLLRASQSAGQPVTANQRFFSENEQAVIQSMVLARKAEELGIVISDSFVNEVLRNLTKDKLRSDELEKIAASYNKVATPKQIFDALRTELLAGQAIQMFNTGLDAHPPEQRWEYFNRMQRRVDAQILAVPVAEFTAQVKDPGIADKSDKELKDYFEKYKNDYAQPASPEPGFHQPIRAKFQYFKADFATVLADQMAKVTDEEIAAYYEKNKQQFPLSKLPPLKDDAKPETEKPDSEKTDAEKSDAAKSSDIEKTDAGKTDAEKSDAEKSNAKAPASDPKEPAAKRDGTKSDESKSDTGKVEDAGKTDDAEKAKDAANDETKTSSINQSPPVSPFRLARFQPAAVDKSDATKTDAAKTDTGKGAAEKKDETKDGATKGEATKIDETTSDAAKSDPAKTGETKDTDPAEPTPDSLKVPALKKDEFQSLDQARDEIRRVLARQKALVAIDEKLSKLRSVMSRYSDDYKQWKILSVTDLNEPKPRPLDIVALAQDYRVKEFETGMLSQLEASVSKLDIAESDDRSNYNPMQGMFGQSWLRAAYSTKDLFRPGMTQDLAENRYLWWKIAQEDDHIPKFEDVRSQVLDAWKLDKARKFAKDKAEQYATAVNKRKEPMRDVFANDKNLPVAEVNGISWLTDNNVPFSMQQEPPRISNVPNVEYAGVEFMQTMFGLEAMQAGVAFNAPKNVAYVVQVTNRNDLAKQEFMIRAKSYERFRNAGFYDIDNSRRDWLKSLNDQYGVKWEREAKAEEAVQ